jgi:hypothetical protein
MDTTTPEGRAAFEAEWNRLCEMTPELIKKDDLVFPHEHQQYVSNEPHFKRVWQHYRDFVFKMNISHLVEEGEISESDVELSSSFLKNNMTTAVATWVLHNRGHLEHLNGDQGFEAFKKIMHTFKFDEFELRLNTAQPLEEQFWDAFDELFEITEEQLMKDLPLFITDPKDVAKIEALADERELEVEEEAATAKLA